MILNKIHTKNNKLIVKKIANLFWPTDVMFKISAKESELIIKIKIVLFSPIKKLYLKKTLSVGFLFINFVVRGRIELPTPCFSDMGKPCDLVSV